MLFAFAGTIVMELCNVACSSVMPGGGTNLELALHCLHDAQGSVQVRPWVPCTPEAGLSGTWMAQLREGEGLSSPSGLQCFQARIAEWGCKGWSVTGFVCPLLIL